MRDAILRLPLLRPYQSVVVTSAATDLVVVSAPQVGKSLAAACWILKEAWTKPGSLSWWAAPTIAMAAHGWGMVARLARSAGIVAGSTEGPPAVLRLINGSRVEGRSWDRPENLAGPSVSALVADEFAGLDADSYGSLTGRRSETLGSARWLGNSDTAGARVAERLWAMAERGEPGFEGVRWTWRTRATEHRCPCGLGIELADADRHRRACRRGTYLRFLVAERGRMAEAQWRAKFEAEWLEWSASPVYAFNRDRNVRPDVVLDPHLPIRLVCDFNVSDLIWLIAQAHNGEAWIVDEVRASGSGTTQTAALDFVRRYGDHEAGVVVHGDATGRSRKTSASRSDYDIIRAVVGGHFGDRFRLDVPSVNGPVVDRINAVNGMLSPATGEPRLWVHPRCTTVIEDLIKTSWKATSRDVDKSDPRRTHASDCAGYLALKVAARRSARPPSMLAERPWAPLADPSFMGRW